MPRKPRTISSAWKVDRPPTTGVPVPGAKGRVETIDIEGQVAGGVADDLSDRGNAVASIPL